MDVILPSWSGPEAYLEMSALRPDIRVIFTTGYVRGTESLISMGKKGAAILQKPCSLTSLRKTVRVALERQLPV
jgi:FixJ family two-component response regulator